MRYENVVYHFCVKGITIRDFIAVSIKLHILKVLDFILTPQRLRSVMTSVSSDNHLTISHDYFHHSQSFSHLTLQSPCSEKSIILYKRRNNTLV